MLTVQSKLFKMFRLIAFLHLVNHMIVRLFRFCNTLLSESVLAPVAGSSNRRARGFRIILFLTGELQSYAVLPFNARSVSPIEGGGPSSKSGCRGIWALFLLTLKLIS